MNQTIQNEIKELGMNQQTDDPSPTSVSLKQAICLQHVLSYALNIYNVYHGLI